MSYAIMRCEKLARMGNVAASLKHCFRERETLNADPEKTPANVHFAAQSTDEAMGKLRKMLPEKRRKDAVLAVEYVMTASPEWWQTATHAQQQEFFDKSLQWLADKYGQDRIFTASIHLDEQTPHLSAFVVPLTKDGRLSAKEFIGNKSQMKNDQTTFAKAVQDLGLERGIEGSQATHERVKRFYGRIAENHEPNVQITADDIEPKTLKKGLFSSEIEPLEDVADRLKKKIEDEYQDTVETAIEGRLAQKRKKELESTAKRLNALLEPFLEQMREMSAQTKEKFLEAVKAIGARLLSEQKAREEARKELKRIQRAELGHKRKNDREIDL